MLRRTFDWLPNEQPQSKNIKYFDSFSSMVHPQLPAELYIFDIVLLANRKCGFRIGNQQENTIVLRTKKWISKNVRRFCIQVFMHVGYIKLRAMLNQYSWIFHRTYQINDLYGSEENSKAKIKFFFFASKLDYSGTWQQLNHHTLASNGIKINFQQNIVFIHNDSSEHMNKIQLPTIELIMQLLGTVSEICN